MQQALAPTADSDGSDDDDDEDNDDDGQQQQQQQLSENEEDQDDDDEPLSQDVVTGRGGRRVSHQVCAVRCCCSCMGFIYAAVLGAHTYFNRVVLPMMLPVMLF
jgi:hypothetical protein